MIPVQGWEGGRRRLFSSLAEGRSRMNRGSESDRDCESDCGYDARCYGCGYAMMAWPRADRLM